MDQQRLATLWRAGIGANLVALAWTVLGWAAPGVIGWWSIVAEGVLVAVVIVVWVRTRPRPFHGAQWRAYSDAQRRAAAKNLLRGEPVDPPALHAEGLDVARRTLWSIGQQGLVGAVMATSLILQRDSPGLGVWLAGFGTAWLLAGLAPVAYLGARRRRLDVLEQAPDAAPGLSRAGGAIS